MRNKFLNDGYILIENYLDANSINIIKEYITKKEPKVYDNFSKIPLARGWGNLVHDELLTNSIQLNDLISKTEDITKASMSCNFVVVNNKPRWVGKDFEFHQEVFNSSSFAAGADTNLVRDNWIQVYMPLDDETSFNGGLCIFQGSHNFGVLDYEDFVDGNFRHKRRVSPSSLDNLERQGCTLKSLNLKAGSLLLFSTYLIHASSNNLSPHDRMSLVLQFEPENFIANNDVFEQEAEFRSSFIQSTLSGLIENEKAKGNVYSELSSKKTKNSD
jgi:ectoine hydroxylase-related dioxygenase (phytanoyl-CoA dioxygenase family)